MRLWSPGTDGACHVVTPLVYGLATWWPANHHAACSRDVDCPPWWRRHVRLTGRTRGMNIAEVTGRPLSRGLALSVSTSQSSSSDETNEPQDDLLSSLQYVTSSLSSLLRVLWGVCIHLTVIFVSLLISYPSSLFLQVIISISFGLSFLFYFISFSFLSFISISYYLSVSCPSSQSPVSHLCYIYLYLLCFVCRVCHQNLSSFISMSCPSSTSPLIY